MTSDPSGEFLSDGLTDELINALGRIPGLRVASRTSAFRFKGRAEERATIVVELMAPLLLEGKVQKGQRGIEICAQLVKAADGETLWCETYKPAEGELAVIQDQIASAIAENLKSQLGILSAAPAQRRPAANVEAYNLYLKGRFYWNKRTHPAVLRSIELFRQALEKDPQFPSAHAGLADAYNILAIYNYAPPLEAYPKAKASALEALELDDNLARAHCTLGCISSIHDWNWAKSESQFSRAIQLNPSYATARQWYAVNCLIPLGRHEEALIELRWAQEADPLSISLAASVGLALYYAGRYEEALAQLRQALEMDENFWLIHLFLGWVYLQASAPKEATAAFERARELGNNDPVAVAALGYAYARIGRRAEAQGIIETLRVMGANQYVPASEYVPIYHALGDLDGALEWLDRAYAERSFKLIYLKVDPRLEALQSHPRFAALLQRLGLADH